MDRVKSNTSILTRSLNLLINDYEDLKKNPKVIDGLFNPIDIAMISRSLKTFSYKQGHKSKIDQEDYETSFVHYYAENEVKKLHFYIKVMSYLKNELNYNLDFDKCYVHSYGMDQKTKIHADNTTPTVMLYCNPQWQPNWGGETIIYDNEGEIKKTIVPRPGRLLVFDGNSMHSGRSTTVGAPDRRYVIVFKLSFIDSDRKIEHQSKEFIN
jgi:Rps23 Pro-64 3,4-dihydroxylase Tpa1-like proline 4-hydroxylase